MKRITVITQQGVCAYAVGDTWIGGKQIATIKLHPLNFTGDPFDHYCGFTKDGEMLFSIYPLTPCVVEYF